MYSVGFVKTSLSTFLQLGISERGTLGEKLGGNVSKHPRMTWSW